MRAEKNGHQARLVTWIPQALELFQRRGQLTSAELTAAFGKSFGGDAVVYCREVGLPLQITGSVNDSKPPQKRYAVDLFILWRALEEAVRQIDRYVVVLRTMDQVPDRQTFRTVSRWIEHVHRIEKLKEKQPGRNNGSLHKIRPTSHD